MCVGYNRVIPRINFHEKNKIKPEKRTDRQNVKDINLGNYKIQTSGFNLKILKF